MNPEIGRIAPILLSVHPAERRQRVLAVGLVGVSVLLVVAALPFAKTKLAPLPAFVPSYEAALIVLDLVTAVLLYGQFAIVGSRRVLLLAAGYVFTAMMELAHALSFPGAFSVTGLLGAGPQSTAWLYMFWHGGFPLFVIAYALMSRKEAVEAAQRSGAAIGTSLLVTAGLAGFLVALATLGHDALPAIMSGNGYAPHYAAVTTATWLLTVGAMAALFRRWRTGSVLDVWLMVVMCNWLFDIALSAVLNAGRYDLGFYAGRIYGLVAAAFVLTVLLIENAVNYARLIEAFDEVVAINKGLDAFSYTVSHDLRAPLRAVEGFAAILQEEHGGKLDQEGRRLLGTLRESAQRISKLVEDLLAFARLGRQPLKTRRVELDTLVRETIAELSAGRPSRRIDFAVGDLGSARADPALLKQALTNLVGNAIKFTRDKDPAVIEIGRVANGQPVYYVRDNGVGFDMRHHDQLFGVFQRLESANDYEGTGIGLAIVHKIISRHGGRVWAESKPGSGATFLFTLQGSEPQRRAA
jgi:signal transduction histidine kinase